MADFSIITKSALETIELGKQIGQNLAGGEVICLIGNLGSGKTHLIKGIAIGLGEDESGEVNSPTFALVNEYTGGDIRLDVYHIDAYRLDSLAEFEMLGFDDMCYERSVVLIEWADKVQALLKDVNYIEVKLSHVNETDRKIELCNISDALAKALGNNS